MNHDRASGDVAPVPDRNLETVLRDIAHHDATLTPPASLERRTMAAYDAWRLALPEAGTRARWPWRAPAMLASAAALLTVILLPLWRSGRVVVRPVEEAVTLASGAAASPDTGAPATEVALDRDANAGAAVLHRRAAAMPRAARRSSTPRGPAPVTPRRLETLRFTRLGPELDDDRAGAFEVSRVQVPRRVLIDLGVLTEGRQGDEPVAADVMFGEDGMARAIRLAPAGRRIP